MTPTTTLVLHNIAYLEQAERLIESLPDDAFIETRSPVFESAIGDHLRHILEHYQAFVAGRENCQIDYDGRKRDHSMARERRVAARAIQELKAALKLTPEQDTAVRVRLDGGALEVDEDPWSDSTLKRELQYLQAHTVHHYALIAFILRLQGRAPSEEFGVAPSTLRHRISADQAAAASS